MTHNILRDSAVHWQARSREEFFHLLVQIEFLLLLLLVAFRHGAWRQTQRPRPELLEQGPEDMMKVNEN